MERSSYTPPVACHAYAWLQSLKEAIFLFAVLELKQTLFSLLIRKIPAVHSLVFLDILKWWKRNDFILKREYRSLEHFSYFKFSPRKTYVFLIKDYASKLFIILIFASSLALLFLSLKQHLFSPSVRSILFYNVFMFYHWVCLTELNPYMSFQVDKYCTHGCGIRPCITLDLSLWWDILHQCDLKTGWNPHDISFDNTSNPFSVTLLKQFNTHSGASCKNYNFASIPYQLAIWWSSSFSNITLSYRLE